MHLPRTTSRARLLAAAALTLGVLGVATAGHLTAGPPPAAAPPRDASAPIPGPSPAGPGVVAQPAEPGSQVRLPGPASRDWVAPGVSPDGGLVRADLAEEVIEFRAADTRPGQRGPFAVSWSGGVAPEPVGSGTGMLGVRPGGWVQFVVRSTGRAADLVLHVAGDVTVAVEGTTRTTTVSGAAGTVTVALGAGGATVTVAPAGETEIGVISAELR
jgi:hypothetical protein